MKSRLQNQFQQIQQSLEQRNEEKINPLIKTIFINQNSANPQWICIFSGKPQTHLQGGNYKIQILFSKDYPYSPPQCTMMDNFQHYHVFNGGKICYKLLNKQHWKINYTILFLLNGIITMLHQNPDVNDPASTTLVKLIDKGPNKYCEPVLKLYYDFLKNQARRFNRRYKKQIEEHGYKNLQELDSLQKNQ